MTTDEYLILKMEVYDTLIGEVKEDWFEVARTKKQGLRAEDEKRRHMGVAGAHAVWVVLESPFGNNTSNLNE